MEYTLIIKYKDGSIDSYIFKNKNKTLKEFGEQVRDVLDSDKKFFGINDSEIELRINKSDIRYTKLRETRDSDVTTF